MAEPMEEVEQVVGVLPSRIEADDKLHSTLSLDDTFEALTEAGVAGGGLGELEFLSSGLKILLEEDGIVAVAGGVDTDAAAAGRLRTGSGLW
jgi:hypothetical protein